MPDPRGSRRLLGGLQATLDQAETTTPFLDLAGFSRPHSGDPVLWAQFFFALAL